MVRTYKSPKPMQDRYSFFKNCYRCGKKFTPLGRYNIYCKKCMMPQHITRLKSIRADKLIGSNANCREVKVSFRKDKR